jgi:hypothetical protein
VNLIGKDLRIAAYQRLVESPSKIPWKFYIVAPKNAVPPYLELSQPVNTQDNGKLCNGEINQLIFNGWDSVTGLETSHARIREMFQDVVSSLTVSNEKNQANVNHLVLPNHDVIRQDYGGIQEIPTFDSKFAHGTLTFNFMIKEK